MMRNKSYIFFVASSDQSRVMKLRIPWYALHFLAVLAVVGGATVLAGMASYSRMLWKAEGYNSVRHERDALKQQFTQLQSTVKDTNQKLDSLQSLATEVAMTYGFLRYRNTPFATVDNSAAEQADDNSFGRTVEEFKFLEGNVNSAMLTNASMHLLPQLPSLGDTTFVPSLWPVNGHLTASFGERLDPFSGEGEFHTGVDISATYGDPVRVTADGVVTSAGNRSGYGRMVVIDHGFGMTTWYGHLSNFNAEPGQQVHRGDIIGYVGVSGRTTGPHVHYEVRLNNAPINPWRYLRYSSLGD
jgi:murein DD-endopeptidase MepM/ murein hydrolase activator NlpD